MLNITYYFYRGFKFTREVLLKRIDLVHGNPKALRSGFFQKRQYQSFCHSEDPFASTAQYAKRVTTVLLSRVKDISEQITFEFPQNVTWIVSN